VIFVAGTEPGNIVNKKLEKLGHAMLLQKELQTQVKNTEKTAE
jgi:hypothetical protein